MKTKTTNKSTWRFYIIPMALAMLASCGEGCISLTGCNLGLFNPAPAPAPAEQSDTFVPLEDAIRSIGQ